MNRMHILNNVDTKMTLQGEWFYRRSVGFTGVAVDDVNVNCVRDVFENVVISV